MKNKKLLRVITLLTAGVVMSGSILLGACQDVNNDDNKEPAGVTPHEHTYAAEWSKDENKHWRAATCEHTAEKKDEAAHDTNGTDGACSVCGYKETTVTPPPAHEHTYATEWSHDENKHWRAATCEHTTEKSGEAAHDTTGTDGACSVCGYKEQTQTPVTPPAPVPYSGTIYVVGDSTVSSFNDNYYMPRYGYGTQLENYFELAQGAKVENLALSGRSSLSFLTESNYTTLKNGIGAGDYLIIGFGHNDEKTDDAARFTDPTADHTTASTAKGPSFQYTLYENYVKLATDKGATPILCTPIVRYSDKADYSGSKAHITADGDYSQAIKTLGAATNTTVIDLTAITKADYTTLGEAAANYHAHTSYNGEENAKVPTGRDDTHINYYGAKMVAYEFATALKDTDCTLKNHVKADIEKPGADDLAAAINADFAKPDYTPFNPDNTTATSLGTVAEQKWFATALGDIGGAKYSNFNISQQGGVFTVGNSGANGKFTSTYGFGAAFMQVDLSQNFTASATITVTKADGNNQSGFGMMIRDDIYINKNSKECVIDTDFAMAGILNTKGAIFSYTDKALVNPTEGPTSVAVGATYTVSITRTDNNYTLTVSDGTHNYTKSYPDLKVNVVDTQYAYLCLCANRDMEVQYSNVTFEYTGAAKEA